MLILTTCGINTNSTVESELDIYCSALYNPVKGYGVIKDQYPEIYTQIKNNNLMFTKVCEDEDIIIKK